MPDITITITLSASDHARATSALAAATGGLSVEDALIAHITATVNNIERQAALRSAMEAVDVPPMTIAQDAATQEQADQILGA